MALTQRPGNAVATNIAPSQSLYIQNLNEKLQKSDLKRNLYMLFTAYGPVLDVTALKTSKMRGQAHVLFRDQQSATQAMRHCQGFEFFGREMKISYAKNRSNTLAKLTGTFVDPSEATAAAAAAAKEAPSSFPAPPGASTGLPPPPGLPQKPNGLQPPAGGAESATSPATSAGTKRPRDESDDEGGDAPMEEDSGGEMEMSDDE
ncbi:U2 small nuclear ribonucleoprotein [Fulvia fulva]|uniref:U2 small nuclear ribonucleoprotein n=1 Tax=Passalora fulva TaxID=5499 RepID=A0A9Q8UUR3_PASFU|nr:U2 small nuclear ribonucleoprotein [Fulvia fulva]KAK4616229.1 U2 small nuclear ribonucleoprotein [Fulvia fulva]KAK4616425.1 U2 small nuclear ribonucleoprotein [Fulvia fulva]UJO23168.1 U2 small nuclear ribonucleoprotein [Fulvia fulva]WPV19338.1 U2 small nuclear ribonucleoprotein [Fulvia fulva]WPV34420.1 U2 small nuclear ribonucleoprotein [Fulvia fulva]